MPLHHILFLLYAVLYSFIISSFISVFLLIPHFGFGRLTKYVDKSATLDVQVHYAQKFLTE